MRKLKFIPGWLAIHLLMAIPLYSQYKFDKAVYITKEDGLPVNSVRVVKKGEDGFIWIGTDDGLCRFDGSEIKVYKQGDDIEHTLFDNSVYAVLPVGNKIWAGTSQGVSVLNTTDQTFKHYQFTENGKADSIKRRFDQAIYNIFRDRQGKIWIGTRLLGAYMYDDEKDDFVHFALPKDKYQVPSPSLGGDNTVLNVEQSRTNDSIIWLGTAGGLLEVNKYSRDIKYYFYIQEVKDYQVALNAFRRLYHHDDGFLYVGSWAAGVNVFDPVTKSFTPLEVKDEDGKKMLTSTISNLTRKSDHEFWISTGNGLLIYDTDKKDVIWHKYNVAAEKKFYSIDFIDESDRIWLSGIYGVLYYDPVVQQFASYSFKEFSSPDWAFAFDIISDKTGNEIIVCPRLTDGLYHFDKIKKTWRKKIFPGNKNFRSEVDVVRSFFRLPSGEFLISSYKGVFIYNEQKGYFIDLTKQFPVKSTRWGEVVIDKFDNLWISVDGFGLIRWNFKTKKFISYTEQLVKGDPENSFGRIVNFFSDSHGNIWFERSGGIGVYIAEKDSIFNFIYKKNEHNSFPTVSCFVEDKNGKIWASSSDGWLGYALIDDPAKGIVHKMDLRSKGIQRSFPILASDLQGNIWGYTTSDVVKINADDLSFTKYSFSYGIVEPDYYHFSFLPTGEIIFGGRNDIVIANPSEFKRNTEIPAPYISELHVLNQPYKNFKEGKQLRLKPKQNFFSIGFSAKAFTMAKNVKFRYKLLGFDDWTETKDQRFANYTNVPGGNYIFQLQVANNEGEWNEKTLEFPIYVATALWLTWWFQAIVVLLLVIAVYSLYRFRVNQFRKKQKMKSEYEKKLANVEMSALLAQMNPHFLFNSLNSIDSYIIRNESRKASEYLNNFARLMRLILQNSRSNYISLKDELEALDLYLQMESLRFKNKFSYSINVDDDVDLNSILIPPMLIQPYVENAIWHGLMHKQNGEAGKVEIRLSKNENDLICVVQDNGIGRKKAAELKAQKQSNHKRSMGMQITQDRIEIINKLYNINANVNIVDLENTVGESEGTKVELTIPV